MEIQTSVTGNHVNKLKYGFDLDDAEAVFDDECAIYLAKGTDAFESEQVLTIGQAQGDKVFVVNYRELAGKAQVISMRLASIGEQRLYHSIRQEREKGENVAGETLWPTRSRSDIDAQISGLRNDAR